MDSCAAQTTKVTQALTFNLFDRATQTAFSSNGRGPVRGLC